ncbi:unnamed protein product [Caenorhabditis angaria]|uniref:EGF-like domain-containing protein n=1 Tax=Caenorhabditis angaria TaxID=860376 RepID=A0A9P1J315_9PELO|nr:unnamed protein product [Caenorhabditis angaria]
MQFYFKIYFSLLFICNTVNARCSGGNCEKFSCVSDHYVHRPLDNNLRFGGTFNSPCSCKPDWNLVFCNETVNSYKSSHSNLPTVCICRQFSETGTKCTQVITRCFQHRNNECSCCFNQPSEWCRQLKCKNREPVFENANTTCVCHQPSDYPFQICSHMPQGFEILKRRKMVDMNVQRSELASPEFIELLGRKVPTTTITYLIVGLLLAISLLTLLMLVIGGNKLKRQRSERQRQTRLARETLIMQRADDDRYLPSA